MSMYPFTTITKAYIITGKKGYIECSLWYVVYGDRFDDTLSNRDGTEFCGSTAIVGQDNQLRLYCWTVQLNIQGIVYAEK